MTERATTIFLSAAEASGDALAAKLIEALRRRLGGARFVGAGGPAMAGAGCEVLVDLTHMASMLGGPFLRLGYYWRTVRRLRKEIARIRPDLHVPVDSPALNWHLAAAAKRAGAKVVHYVAPQVWAWAPWRVGKLARLSDHVACILPFEPEWLRARGVPATYVGHPLFDDLPPRPNEPPNLIEAYAQGCWRVALLPGSRPGEIKGHSRAMAKVAAAIRNRWPEARCVFVAGDERAAAAIRAALGPDSPGGAEIAAGNAAEVLARSHVAVAASGTVTLTAAHYGVPMVIVYKVSRLVKNIARLLVRTPRLSLVNILARRKLVPELMPWHGNVGQLTAAVLDVMDDLGWLIETRRQLIDLTAPLRAEPPASASDNAAALIVDVLRGRSPATTPASRAAPRGRERE